MAELLTSKSGHKATTTTPLRTNAVSNLGRRNTRKGLRKSKRA